MSEVPANVPGAGVHAHIIGTTRDGNSYSTKEKASSRIADNDSDAALINNLVRVGAVGNPLDAKNNLTITGIITENLLNLKQLAKKLENRLRENGNSVNGLKDSGVLNRLKEQIQAFTAGKVLENLKKEIEALTNSGNNIDRLKKQIEALMAFERVLLGVQRQIDDYTEYMQFCLGQVKEDDETGVIDNLELGKFTAARMGDEAVRALRGQANLNPERVLSFLKNTVKVEETA